MNFENVRVGMNLRLKDVVGFERVSNLGSKLPEHALKDFENVKVVRVYTSENPTGQYSNFIAILPVHSSESATYDPIADSWSTEHIIYENEIGFFELVFDTSPEKIRQSAENLLLDLAKKMKDGGYSSISEMMFGFTLQDPDIICANCGRIVLVGRCCKNPNIVDRKELTPEEFNRIIQLTKAKADPTPELKNLMNRGMK